MQADDVRASEQVVQIRVLHASLDAFLIGVQVVGDHLAAESAHDLGELHTDATGTDDAHGTRVDVEAEQSVEDEVVIPDAVVGFVQLAVE